MQKTYDGWADQVTWRASYRMHDFARLPFWRGLAESHAREAIDAHPGDPKGTEARQAAAASLAEDIRRRLIDECPMWEANVYCDLVLAALDAIDYQAIARQLLRGLFGEGDFSRRMAPSDYNGGFMSCETYLLLLWATEDRQAADRWFETASSCARQAERMETLEDDGASAAAHRFAEALRDQLPRVVSDGTSLVQRGLIDCALSRVDWPSLARRLLAEYCLPAPD